MNEFCSYICGRRFKPAPSQNPVNANVTIHVDRSPVATWEVKDEIALTFFHMAIHDSIDQNITNVATSKEAWNTLLSLFER